MATREHRGGPRKFYVFYDKATDDIVAIGSAEECATQMGRTRKYVVNLAREIKCGRYPKYEVYTENL